MEPDLYWTMIEPYWKRVTIYEGGEPFLREYARTPEAARNLLSTHWCQSEVCNGGLHQLFFNPTGILAPEAVVGDEAIGLLGLGSVAQRAVEFFGPLFPREEEERQRALKNYALTHPLACDPFGELNEEFFELSENEAGGWPYGTRFLAMLVPHRLAVWAVSIILPGSAPRRVTMSETNLANTTKRSAELSVAAGAILALMAAATWFGSARAQQKEKIPDFSLDSKSAWT